MSVCMRNSGWKKGGQLCTIDGEPVLEVPGFLARQEAQQLGADLKERQVAH